MKADIYDINGKKVGDVLLPKFFDQPVRQDIIKRAYLHETSYSYQPKGTDPMAGMKTSADYLGRKESYRSMKNRGQSKVPREKLPEGRQGNARVIPSTVGGRRAHPPRVEKRIIERMNKKEYFKALLNSIAATAHVKLVNMRGHKFNGNVPIILSDDFEKLNKTKDVNNALLKIAHDDMLRSRDGRKKNNARAVKSRTYVPRSILIITDNESPLLKTAKNIPGIDVVPVDEVNVSLLAPGGKPARLTAFTQGAIKKLSEMITVVG
ncbi:50S ribosomal protein L4 [Candidatus Micrarchaeota archaeon]|nr:50S ribosomal protein L4 [Candidatus Micrarchaeota archaeon]